MNKKILEIKILKLKMKNLFHLVRSREMSKRYEPLLRERIYTEMFKTFRQNPIKTDDDDKKFNKVYSSVWLDDQLIVFGTKDKRLYLFNVKSNKILLIEDYRTEEDKTEEGKINSTGIKSIDHMGNKFAVSVNNKIDIFSHNIFTIDKMKTLSNNQSWISNIKWINDNELFSSSRDGTIQLWNINNNANNTIYKYDNVSLEEMYNQNYARHFSYKNKSNNLYSVTPNGVIKYIDIVKQKSTFKFNCNVKECVVSKLNGNIFTVGSTNVVKFFDTRTKKSIMEIPNFNPGWGTRSLEWYNENILSIGGGDTNLAFFDNRKNNGFIDIDIGKKYYEIDPGWVERNPLYYNFQYQGVEEHTAIYTHTYNPSKNKIFVGGGPTPMGLFGSFVTILQ